MPVDVSISLVSPSNGVVVDSLSFELVARVTRDGVPVEGASVAFLYHPGNQWYSADGNETDSDGYARGNWRDRNPYSYVSGFDGTVRWKAWVSADGSVPWATLIDREDLATSTGEYTFQILPYDVHVDAYCEEHSAYRNVGFTFDGSSYTTSLTFSDLMEDHILVAPDHDGDTGHVFKEWYKDGVFYSSEKSVTVSEAGTYTIRFTSNPLVPPSGLSALAVSSSQIDLSWSDNSDDETAFHIERMQSGGSWVEMGIVGEDVTSYSDTGLSPSTTYYYRVRTYRSSDDQYSTYSNEESPHFPNQDEIIPVYIDGVRHEVTVDTTSTEIHSANIDQERSQVAIQITGETGTLGKLKVSLPLPLLSNAGSDHNDIMVFVNDLLTPHTVETSDEGVLVVVSYHHSTANIHIYYKTNPLTVITKSMLFGLEIPGKMIEITSIDGSIIFEERTGANAVLSDFYLPPSDYIIRTSIGGVALSKSISLSEPMTVILAPWFYIDTVVLAAILLIFFLYVVRPGTKKTPPPNDPPRTIVVSGEQPPLLIGPTIMMGGQEINVNDADKELINRAIGAISESVSKKEKELSKKIQDTIGDKPEEHYAEAIKSAFINLRNESIPDKITIFAQIRLTDVTFLLGEKTGNFNRFEIDLMLLCDQLTNLDLGMIGEEFDSLSRFMLVYLRGGRSFDPEMVDKWHSIVGPLAQTILQYNQT